MKKTIIAIAIGLSMAGLGCAANWYQQFESNAPAIIASFESVEQTVLNDIAVAWSAINIITPLPASAVTQYNNAVVAVNDAVSALNSALEAAALSQQPISNLSALMADVTNAVAQVLAIINEYGGNVSAKHGQTVSQPIPGLADANAGYVQLRNWH
jgi:hypothetical protein